ncbi:MAG: N-acetyltransferase [Bacteroidetes bacterium]|nr:MAG: N-acetyltransferase [Bacteroidota bacterium]
MKTRIYLEKLSPQDFESFYTLTGNEKVMAMITERPLSEEEALKKFNYFLENNKLHKSFGSFRLLEVGSSKLMGFAKLEITKEKPQEAELGYMLLPEFWGNGFGNEIAEILLEVAKLDPKLKRVYANTDPNNVASRKILIKNGFTSEEINELDGLPNEVFGRQLHN